MLVATMVDRFQGNIGFPAGGRVDATEAYKWLNQGQRLVASFLPMDAKQQLIKEDTGYIIVTAGLALPTDYLSLISLRPNTSNLPYRRAEDSKKENAWTEPTATDPVYRIKNNKVFLYGPGVLNNIACTLRYYQLPSIGGAQESLLDPDLHELIILAACILWFEVPTNTPGQGAVIKNWNNFVNQFALVTGEQIKLPVRPRNVE